MELLTCFIIPHPVKIEGTINLQPQYCCIVNILTSSPQQGIWLIPIKLILP